MKDWGGKGKKLQVKLGTSLVFSSYDGGELGGEQSGIIQPVNSIGSHLVDHRCAIRKLVKGTFF